MRHKLAKSVKNTSNPGLKRELWTAFSKCDSMILHLTQYYRSVKIWVIAINVAVIISMCCSGCKTINGFGGDLQDWTSNNIQDK